jgi:hypothetical protein
MKSGAFFVSSAFCSISISPIFQCLFWKQIFVETPQISGGRSIDPLLALFLFWFRQEGNVLKRTPSHGAG